MNVATRASRKGVVSFTARLDYYLSRCGTDARGRATIRGTQRTLAGMDRQL
jgi:hypothetical protein